MVCDINREMLKVGKQKALAQGHTAGESRAVKCRHVCMSACVHVCMCACLHASEPSAEELKMAVYLAQLIGVLQNQSTLSLTNSLARPTERRDLFSL